MAIPLLALTILGSGCTSRGRDTQQSVVHAQRLSVEGQSHESSLGHHTILLNSTYSDGSSFESLAGVALEGRLPLRITVLSDVSPSPRKEPLRRESRKEPKSKFKGQDEILLKGNHFEIRATPLLVDGNLEGVSAEQRAELAKNCFASEKAGVAVIDAPLETFSRKKYLFEETAMEHSHRTPFFKTGLLVCLKPLASL